MRYLSIALSMAATFTAATALQSATLQEDFSRDPAENGWAAFGNAALFTWQNEHLAVTWDSSQTNSYFLHPLHTILTRQDDFSLALDLTLRDIAVGTTPNKPYSFQFAFGFLNRTAATLPGFIRGTGTDSPNLAEFDYFPDSGLGATVSPTLISSNSQFAYSFNFPLEMGTNILFHIQMTYTASNQTLSTVVTSNGLPFGPIQPATIAPPFSDFHLDQLAIMSYSDAGQDPQFAGSILAHGKVDNIVAAFPDPPVMNLRAGMSNGVWQAAFLSRSNWVYRLERTTDFHSWTPLPESSAGTGGEIVLRDSGPAFGNGFFRIAADKP